MLTVITVWAVSVLVESPLPLPLSGYGVLLNLRKKIKINN